MFELQFRNEPYARRETMAEDQDEPMEIEDTVGIRRLVEMKVHVSRQGSRRRIGAIGGCLPRDRPAEPNDNYEGAGQTKHKAV